MFRSLRASRRLSNPSYESQGIPLNDSVLQLKSSRGQDFMHREVLSTTSLTGWSDTVDDPLIASTQEPRFTAYDGPASTTASVNSSTAEKNMLHPKFGPAAVAMLLLALYSTVLSGIWLAVAIVQPRWGFKISTTHGLSPGNAATLIALVGKTIEIASAAVFVSCIGQALTRRAVAEKSAGITLADMTIRNWVIQPGFIFTHSETLAIAGRTIFGALALLALVATLLYTTASEALVSPKLKYGEWETRELVASVHSYYGNFVHAGIRCTHKPDLMQKATDDGDQEARMIDALLCLGHELNYQSTRDLLTFSRDHGAFGPAEDIELLGNETRPAEYTLLHDNITMFATHVDTEFSDIAELYQRWGRIIDNVTVSIPHPGVWSASHFPDNKILQPGDLSNAGGFSIKAAVVSPTLNTLCVNMDEDELAPLVYSEFPYSEMDFNEKDFSESPFGIWVEEEMAQWDNSTVVDDVFRWGSKYGRRRPVFEAFPDYIRVVYHLPNTILDPILNETDDAGYLLARIDSMRPGAGYALCQMRSWLSTDCSTHLEIPGVGQPIMRAHCGDDDDVYRYDPSVSKSPDRIEIPDLWPSMLNIWRKGIALEKASDDRLYGVPFMLTAGILRKPERGLHNWTISNVLSVLLLSTLSSVAVDTQLRHTWNHSVGEGIVIVNKTNILSGFNATEALSDFNATESFRAGVRSQEYTSGHTESWQRVFYLVLGLNFALNLLCLVYLFRWSGLIDDITEPQNHFSLAMSSPLSSLMDGSYPNGPEKQHWGVSWRVSQSSTGSGCRFDECNKSL